MSEARPFELRSVVHLVRPAGSRARDLEGLRAGIAGATPATLFYHAVQCPLRRPTSSETPPDDLSAWVHGVVQDRETAERISFAVQSRAGTADELRGALLEVLDHLSEKDRISRDAPAESEFVFLTAESVPVPTGMVARHAEELMTHLSQVDHGVWFYHLLEEPWYLGAEAPIVLWSRECGHARVASWLEEEFHAGHGLEEMRRRVLRRWQQSRLRTRVAAAAEATESERREAGRAAVAGLVRRITGVEETPTTAEGRAER